MRAKSRRRVSVQSECSVVDRAAVPQLGARTKTNDMVSQLRAQGPTRLNIKPASIHRSLEGETAKRPRIQATLGFITHVRSRSYAANLGSDPVQIPKGRKPEAGRAGIYFAENVAIRRKSYIGHMEYPATDRNSVDEPVDDVTGGESGLRRKYRSSARHMHAM